MPPNWGGGVRSRTVRRRRMIRGEWGHRSWTRVGKEIGGEAGIRTLGRALRPYNGLANRRLQPLGHLTATRSLSIRQRSHENPDWPRIVPKAVPANNAIEAIGDTRSHLFPPPRNVAVLPRTRLLPNWRRRPIP